MPRLFAALELPRLISERLGILRGEISGARWVAPENMHITLRFAGDVGNETARAFAEELGQIDFLPFELQISGAGHFGGHEPTAVFATVAASSALDQLRRAVDRAARAAGVPPEGQPFKPHVTLARMRSGRTLAVAQFLADCGDMKLAPFTIDRFVLMSSRPGSGGGPYAIEEAYHSSLGDYEPDA